MTYWGRVNDLSNRIVELQTLDPAGRYHPSMKWVKIPTYLEAWGNTKGDYTVDETDTVIPVNKDAFLKQVEDRIAQRKYQESVRGVEHNGFVWHTSESGRNNLNNTIALGQRIDAANTTGETFSTRWKTLSGWTDVTVADLEEVGMVIGQYVAACFSREKDILDLVEAALGTNGDDYQNAISVFNTEISKYGTDGWPGEEPDDDLDFL